MITVIHSKQLVCFLSLSTPLCTSERHLCNPIHSGSAMPHPYPYLISHVRAWYTVIHTKKFVLFTPIHPLFTSGRQLSQRLCHAAHLSIPYQSCQGNFYPYPYFTTSVFYPLSTPMYLGKALMQPYTHTKFVRLGHTFPLSIVNN